MHPTPPLIEFPKSGAEARGSRWGLWWWFLAGFFVIFAGMLFGVTMYTMLPSGRGLVATPLWRYYLIEGERAAFGHGTLGPLSGTSSILENAMMHLACSIVGGVFTLGIGWGVGLVRNGGRAAPALADSSPTMIGMS